VFSEKVANADYERVMREFAEKGNTLIVGESFAVEAAARKVAKDYPKVSFLMGSSASRSAELRCLRQLHPGARISDGHDRRRDDRRRTGSAWSAATRSRSEPLMHAFMEGAKETNPKVEFMVTVHRLVVRSAEGEGSAFAMIEKAPT
jgi:hypothetical protein